MMDQQVYLKNVVTLTLNPQACTGCGLCTIVCPHRVFKIKDKRAIITSRDLCMECGACAMNCESGAITVKRGVGCAAAVINSKLKNTEPSCGCDGVCCN